MLWLVLRRKVELWRVAVGAERKAGWLSPSSYTGLNIVTDQVIVCTVDITL